MIYNETMFGIGFIIFGLLVLFHAFGYFGQGSGSTIWGIILIVIGIALGLAQLSRRERRARWIAKWRSEKQQAKNNGSDSEK